MARGGIKDSAMSTSALIPGPATIWLLVVLLVGSTVGLLSRDSTFERSHNPKLCYAFGYAGAAKVDCVVEDAGGHAELHSRSLWNFVGPNVTNITNVAIEKSPDGRLIGYAIRSYPGYIDAGTVDFALQGPSLTSRTDAAYPGASAPTKIKLVYDVDFRGTIPFPFVLVFATASDEVVIRRLDSGGSIDEDSLNYPPLPVITSLRDFDIRNSTQQRETMIAVLANYSYVQMYEVAFNGSRAASKNTTSRTYLGYTDAKVVLHPWLPSYCASFAKMSPSRTDTQVYYVVCIDDTGKSVDVASASGGADTIISTHTLEFTEQGLLCFSVTIQFSGEPYFFTKCVDDVFGTPIGLPFNVSKESSASSEASTVSPKISVAGSASFSCSSTFYGTSSVPFSAQWCNMTFWNNYTMNQQLANAKLFAVSSDIYDAGYKYCSLYRGDGIIPTYCRSTTGRASEIPYFLQRFSDYDFAVKQTYYDAHLRLTDFGSVFRLTRGNVSFEVVVADKLIYTTDAANATLKSFPVPGYYVNASDPASQVPLQKPGDFASTKAPGFSPDPFDVIAVPKTCFSFWSTAGLVVDCFVGSPAVVLVNGTKYNITRVRPLSLLNISHNAELTNIDGMDIAHSMDNQELFVGYVVGTTAMLVKVNLTYGDTFTTAESFGALTAQRGSMKVLANGNYLFYSIVLVDSAGHHYFQLGSPDFLAQPITFEIANARNQMVSYDIKFSYPTQEFIYVIFTYGSADVTVTTITLATLTVTSINPSLFAPDSTTKINFVEPSFAPVSSNSNVACMQISYNWTKLSIASNTTVLTYSIYCLDASKSNLANGALLSPWWSDASQVLKAAMVWKDNSLILCFSIIKAADGFFACANVSFSSSNSAIPPSLNQSSQSVDVDPGNLVITARGNVACSMFAGASKSVTICSAGSVLTKSNNVIGNPPETPTLTAAITEDGAALCYIATKGIVSGKSAGPYVGFVQTGATSPNVLDVENFNSISSTFNALHLTKFGSMCALSHSNTEPTLQLSLQCNENSKLSYRGLLVYSRFDYNLDKVFRTNPGDVPLAKFLNIDPMIGALRPPPLVSPTPPPVSSPVSSCMKSSPWRSFVCINGIWVSNVSVIINTVNVTLGSAQINGNLTIPEQGGLIIDDDLNVTGSFDIGNQSFLIIDSNSTVVVEGSLTVGGDSQIQLNASDPSNGQSIIKITDCLSPSGGKLNVSVSKTGTYNLLQFKCISGRFADVSGFTTEHCKAVKTTATYGETSLQAFFEIVDSDEDECAKATDGLGENAIIGLAVAGAAVVLIIVAIAIVFGVPSIRSKVLPHRDRAHWEPKKG